MSKKQKKELTHKIRPAARLINTIGEDLIGDPYSAIVELVKNSYDADATEVQIVFDYKTIEGISTLNILIIDDGVGMNYDTVTNKWLVPATNDKIKNKLSPSGLRKVQGRKGIGRFAAALLGQEMLMETVHNGLKTSVFIDWTIFDEEEFLSDVELLVEESKTGRPNGTNISIFAQNKLKKNEEGLLENDDRLSYWTDGKFGKLLNELQKLISPIKEGNDDNFSINLKVIDSPFESRNNEEVNIEVLPILEFYDYRITGFVDSENLEGKLTFENNVEKPTQSEEFEFIPTIPVGSKFKGRISFDLRVFDREPEAIENLINKGLIDPISNKFLGKREAKRLLNEVYGINIYRNNFRVRPYGNGGVDWLNLDKDRIQNPSLRVSNNQVAGFIFIQSEELSGLEEKSARDGLKENDYYDGIYSIMKQVIQQLETRRFSYRKRTRKSRGSINDTVEELFSFSDLSDDLEKKLKKLDVSQNKIEDIKNLIKGEAKRKSKLLDSIQKTIAIYQGQATLGKIVSFILHEGRKSIHFLNNESKHLERYVRHYIASRDQDLLEDIKKVLEGYIKHGDSLSKLFKRINPLASQTRGPKKNFSANQTILDAILIFKRTLEQEDIIYEIKSEDDVELYGWSNDLYIALANFLENSIYWLGQIESNQKKIIIDLIEVDGIVRIDYRDNGPGLTKEEVKEEVIFEPGYSKKLNGTGLGLAIAGESIDRLGGTLIALNHPDGAYFQIEIKR